jgi:hypothetical protein
MHAPDRTVFIQKHERERVGSCFKMLAKRRRDPIDGRFRASELDGAPSGHQLKMLRALSEIDDSMGTQPVRPPALIVGAK